jgi:hypothetical protein
LTSFAGFEVDVEWASAGECLVGSDVVVELLVGLDLEAELVAVVDLVAVELLVLQCTELGPPFVTIRRLPDRDQMAWSGTILVVVDRDWVTFRRGGLEG